MVQKNIMAMTIISFVITISCIGQNNVIFDFNTSVPTDSVTHVFINLNFNFSEEIPEGISWFKNLQELTFFEQSDFFLENNWKQKRYRFVDIKEAKIKSIPASISNCDQLRVLQIPEGKIDSLPDSFSKLDKLEQLELPTSTNLNSIIKQLLKLRSLQKIECFSCSITDGNREKLMTVFPNINMVITMEDLRRDFQDCQKFTVDVNKNKGLVFNREIEADMFIESTPIILREYYNLSKAEK